MVVDLGRHDTPQLRTRADCLSTGAQNRTRRDPSSIHSATAINFFSRSGATNINHCYCLPQQQPADDCSRVYLHHYECHAWRQPKIFTVELNFAYTQGAFLLNVALYFRQSISNNLLSEKGDVTIELDQNSTNSQDKASVCCGLIREMCQALKTSKAELAVR
jgi:hypothetical protein